MKACGDSAGGYKRRDGSSAAKRSRKGSFTAPTFFVVAYDYGIKYNILRNLAEVGLPGAQWCRRRCRRRRCWR